MMSPADYIAQLESVVREQMAALDELRAAIDRKDAELDGLIAWIATDADALGALQSVYADPRSSPAIKTKAAIGAIAFERSKPATVTVIADFRGRVENARERTIELRKQEWQRQEQPAELTSTILGGDHEGEALGPDPAA
jgi:hypothetical protein